LSISDSAGSAGAVAIGGLEGLTAFVVDGPVLTLDGAGVREAS